MPAEAAAASHNPSRPAAYALLALVILLWGVNWPVMKAGLDYLGPLTFAAVRMAMGALIMGAVAGFSGQLRLPAASDWSLVVLIGLLQMAGFMALVTTALQYVPAGRSAILAYTTPLWVTPAALLLLGERLNPWKTLGLAVGLGGVAVLFNPFSFAWHRPEVVLGNGLLLLAALLWAVLIVRIRRHRWQGSPLSLIPWQFLVAAAALLPLALWAEGGQPVRWGWELGVVLLYNGPLATAFCFWAIITVNRALPAITTSLGTLGVPVCGLAASALFLGEPLTPAKTAGLGLVLGGLLLVTLGDRRGAAGG